MEGSPQTPLFRGNTVFPLSLLSQVSALILLTEHTVTVEEQGRFPECVFWKAGDFCSPLWGGLKDICHVCFQKCLSEMWHPDWHPYREMILSARRIPPPSSTVRWSLGEFLCLDVCDECGVDAVQQNAQGHPQVPVLDSHTSHGQVGPLPPHPRARLGTPKIFSPEELLEPSRMFDSELEACGVSWGNAA